VPENLLLVGADASAPPVAGQQPHSGAGLINAGLEGWPSVEEYALSKPVQVALGIEERDHRYRPAEWHSIRHALHLHDDCFASVEPVDDALLQRLVLGALKLHSHYLGQEVEWQSCSEELTLLLREVEEIELRSDSKAGAVYVDQPHQNARREKGLPVKPYHGEIVIRDGKASFHLGDTS